MRRSTSNNPQANGINVNSGHEIATRDREMSGVDGLYMNGTVKSEDEDAVLTVDGLSGVDAQDMHVDPADQRQQVAGPLA